jgi:hypothetical protein
VVAEESNSTAPEWSLRVCLEKKKKVVAEDLGPVMARELSSWLDEGWTLQSGLDSSEAEEEARAETEEWFRYERDSTLATDSRDLLLRLRTSTPRNHSSARDQKSVRCPRGLPGEEGGGGGEGEGVRVVSARTLAERSYNLMLQLKGALMAQVAIQAVKALLRLLRLD